MILENQNDMHHDSNMEGADSNAYGHFDGPMMRAQAKQLQSALTCQISTTETSMSLRACELNGNGSNMFDEFGFAVSPWTNFSLNLFLYNAWAIKSYSICFSSSECHLSRLSNHACIGVFYKKLWLF
jgi:hypothetical protein